MSVILPVEKGEVRNKLENQVVLIYGRPKIGKSTFASKFVKPLFLATEPGLNHLSVYRVNCPNWATFLEACRAVAANPHDFKTIVIDTIDNLASMCSEHVCKENGVNHPSDMPHGKGWALVTYELRRVVEKLMMLPYGLVMISHSVQEEIETKTAKFNRWTISVSGKNKNIFLDSTDIILFIDSDIDKDGEEKRIIRTKPSRHWDAGDRSGLLPEILPLDFDKFSSYFAKDVNDSK